jgi:hypothetical protein
VRALKFTAYSPFSSSRYPRRSERGVMGESTPRSIGKDEASLNEGVQSSLTSTTEAARLRAKVIWGPFCLLDF